MSDPSSPLVAIVTGANTGIGKVTARALAATGRHVFLACRSRAKAEAAVAEIVEATGNPNVEFLELELASLASVRESAAVFLARGLPLQLLVNNAGLVPGPRAVTVDGFEMTFGVNHLGHFLFTTLLLDRIRESSPARIVTVASRAHTRFAAPHWESFTAPTASRTGFPEYAASKLANVWFSAELARRLEGTGVSTYAVHPGVVATDIWRRIPAPFRWIARRFMLDEEQGAATTLHCALDPGAGSETGLYYSESKAVPTSPAGQDRSLAEELWRRSEAWVD